MENNLVLHDVKPVPQVETYKYYFLDQLDTNYIQLYYNLLNSIESYKLINVYHFTYLRILKLNKLYGEEIPLLTYDKDRKITSKDLNDIFSDYIRSRYYPELLSVLICHSISIPIIEKIKSKQSTYKGFMDKVVSIRRPFGIPSNYKPKSNGIPCVFTQKIGQGFVSKDDYTDPMRIKDKWKLLVPFAPIAGQTDFSKPIRFFNENNTQIIPPGVICSESLIVLFSSNDKSKVENFRSYLNTKIFRFLLLQMVISQNITRSAYGLVPNLTSYDKEITDEDLIRLWDISEDEWKFIDSKIS